VQVVIDSVTLKHVVRQPRVTSKSKRSSPTHENPLHEPIRLRKIKLALDAARGLISEWEKTCGPDIKVLVAYWGEHDGILLIQNPPSPGAVISKRLKILGFGNDTIDKLVLRIALGTVDRIIVSDDSDFWDPKRPNDRKLIGNPNAPVSRLCREELKVTILLFQMLLSKLK